MKRFGQIVFGVLVALVVAVGVLYVTSPDVSAIFLRWPRFLSESSACSHLLASAWPIWLPALNKKTNYPLMPVSATPWMNCFCAKKKRISIGATFRTEIAIT